MRLLVAIFWGLSAHAQAPANTPTLQYLQDAAPAPFKLEKAPEPEGKPVENQDADVPPSIVPGKLPGLDAQQIYRIYRTSVLIDTQYIDPVESKQLFYGAMRGMLKTLDENSQFYTPEEMAEFDRLMIGSFGGIGVTLKKMDDAGPVAIIVIQPGAPAQNAGLKVGDKIVEVDGVDVRGMPFARSKELIPGEVGAPITLKISRVDPVTGRDGHMTFTMLRAVVESPNVLAAALPGRVGYVYMHGFRADSASDVAAAIKTLQDQGAESLILDLREDVGGLLDAAHDLAALFLKPDQVITKLRGRDGDEAQDLVDQAGGTFKDLPLKVLVNGYSASASEIVAGAIQDNKRGLIIGSRTYGKGTAQEVFRLTDGSGFKLTKRRWLTPNGHSIQKDAQGHGGITPDVAVDVPREREKEIILDILSRLTGAPADPKIEDPALQAALK